MAKSVPAWRDGDDHDAAGQWLRKRTSELKRQRYRGDGHVIKHAYRTGSFLREHRADWEAGKVVLPGWASYRNVVFTEAWRKHFAGCSLDDPRPILMAPCPTCGAAAWEYCKKISNGNRRSRYHGPRVATAVGGKLDPSHPLHKQVGRMQLNDSR